MTILSKLATIIIDGKPYVNAVLINDLYKTLPRKSGSTQKKLVNELQLDQPASVWRRNKDKAKVGTIATRILDQFKPQMQDLYVDVHEIETPKDGPNKQNHIELLRMISELPNLATDPESNESESELDDEPEQPTVVTSAASIVAPIVVAPSATQVLMPIIELEEHEMFRDANDQVFPIEVRGERSKDKILFKAKDVAAFAENDQFIKNMMKGHTSYQYGKDYLFLDEHQRVQCTHQNLQENSIPLLVGSTSSVNGRGINHDLVYLTLAGLLRVAAVSRSGNANLVKLFSWLQNLFYVHQFGSYEERNELARSMFKQVLNDRLAGLYCVYLGTFNDLYDSMNISRETYPPEQYGRYLVCKFGLSENMAMRLTQHKNKTTGYGQYSTEVVLKWLILVSPSQLSKAEVILSNLLKSHGYTFDHTDKSKSHKELIMFDPLKEHKVKQIYRQVLDLYPSKENELSKALEDAESSFETKVNLIQTTADKAIMKAQHETKMDLIKAERRADAAEHETQLIKVERRADAAEHESQLIKAERRADAAEHETQLIKAELLAQSQAHQIEMLQSKLAKFNLD
jgi:hypothetical protein